MSVITKNVPLKGRTLEAIKLHSEVRRMLAVEYRNCGMTYVDIGKQLNVSGTRAKQLISLYEYEHRKEMAHNG